MYSNPKNKIKINKYRRKYEKTKEGRAKRLAKQIKGEQPN